jgi:hypothetical protein
LGGVFVFDCVHLDGSPETQPNNLALTICVLFFVCCCWVSNSFEGGPGAQSTPRSPLQQHSSSMQHTTTTVTVG